MKTTRHDGRDKLRSKKSVREKERSLTVMTVMVDQRD